MKETLISKEELKTLVTKKFKEVDISSSDAEIVADVLVHADLRGVHSHGVLRTEHYINRIKSGGLNTSPNFNIEYTGPTTAKFNGDNALGHIVAKNSVEKAIEMAKENGVGVVVAHNSSHCGALSYFVKQAAEANMIGVAMTHTDKIVVPFGGKERFFGTNPIAFGFPAKKSKPVILDMATSNVAFGKILHARETGKDIPKDWGVDEDGNPSENPHEVEALLPFAGPKGYGLAMVVDIFSGLLAGAAFGPHIKPMYDELNEMRELGHFFLVLNPSYFTNIDYFLSSMDQMINELHEVPPIQNFDGVMVPGEPEQQKEDERLKEGIPVTNTIYSYLKND